MYRVEIIAAQGSIFWKIPLPLGRGISVIWGKIYKKEKRKRGKCRRKRKKGERKRDSLK